MKYAAIAAALIAAVSAQTISDLPTCSLQCIVTAVTGTGCSVTDYKCACGKSEQLTSSVTPCVQTACPSAADQAKVITVLEGICANAGVPIVISTPGSGGASSTPAPAPSSSEAPASTPEASTPVASTPVASTPVASAPVASTPEASTPAASTPAGYSTPAGTPSSSYCTVTTSYTTVTPSSGATITYASSNGTVTTASPTQFTGAAAQHGVPVAAAGLFAALAYVL